MGRLDAQFGWLPAPAEDAPPVRVVLTEDLCQRSSDLGAARPQHSCRLKQRPDISVQRSVHLNCLQYAVSSCALQSEQGLLLTVSAIDRLGDASARLPWRICPVHRCVRVPLLAAQALAESRVLQPLLPMCLFSQPVLNIFMCLHSHTSGCCVCQWSIVRSLELAWSSQTRQLCAQETRGHPAQRHAPARTGYHMHGSFWSYSGVARPASWLVRQRALTCSS